MNLMHVCPVCNGISTLAIPCPQCGQLAADCGRADDFAGPYAPYGPIDEMKRTNGFLDLAVHACVHSLYCERCSQSFAYAVPERNA